jgi:hypothetical protein
MGGEVLISLPILFYIIIMAKNIKKNKAMEVSLDAQERLA